MNYRPNGCTFLKADVLYNSLIKPPINLLTIIDNNLAINSTVDPANSTYN